MYVCMYVCMYVGNRVTIEIYAGLRTGYVPFCRAATDIGFLYPVVLA